jgi:hypothetical protein
MLSFVVISGLCSSAVPAWGQESESLPDNSIDSTTGPTCITLVSSPEQPKTRRGRAVFSATEILDLEFHVLLPRRLPGEHSVELRVHTPRGHLYQSLTVPFSATRPPSTGTPSPRGRSREARTRIVPNYPFPVEEQDLLPVRYQGRRFARVTARLPVGGTSITTSSLYGLWSVEAYLDGSNVPCSPKRSFTIIE